MPAAIPLRKPEIMSPAGYWPQLQAAVEGGADSVYFGLKHFTARAKVGFALSELPEVMRTLHARGVKGYVTFNTLVFDHELHEAARALASIVEAGADAIIVQDLSVLQIARRLAPDLEIHGSTQMSITSAAGVEFAAQLGVRRVTLARELSLEEVRAIRGATSCELEIFVHGALCVAYSGQCFSSEAWGGRSANRGQCAQACRLPYQMVVDGIVQPLGDARYLLSPGDLYALHHVPEIVHMGISALKIEGRYKDADYVSLTTRAYRTAVDEAWSGAALSITRAQELQIEQVYSRGLGPHFISGTNHQTVVQGRAPRHRGVLIGRVVRVMPDAVVIGPSEAHRVSALKPGDGLVFDAASWRSPEEPEEGGRVFDVEPSRGGNLELRFGNGAINGARIRQGDLVWRTHDPEVDKALRTAPAYCRPVDVRVTAREHEPLIAEWSDGRNTVRVQSPSALQPASKRGVTKELLRDQFGRLGGTPYVLHGIELELSGRPFAPASILNQMRRQALERLQALAVERPLPSIQEPRSVVPSPRATPAANVAPVLHMLVRTAAQLDAAIAAQPASITLDYLDLYGLRPSLERVKQAGIVAAVASPRVLKPGEEKIIDFLLRLDAAILVRSTGLLNELKSREHPMLAGDFSLNAANYMTADLLLAAGLVRLAPTYDLNADQIAALARAVGGNRIEAIAYSHMPVFHTEHCVFCRFMSTGTSYKDCGRPCESHTLALRDAGDRAHPVVADVGCRNTVFGAEAQDASIHLPLWLDAGIRHFRLEFVNETPSQVLQVAEAFRLVLAGKKSADALGRELRQLIPSGTTQGSLYVPRDYMSLPILQ